MPDIIRALRPVPSGLQHMGLTNRFLYSDFTKEHLDPRETTLFLEENLKVGMNKILSRISIMHLLSFPMRMQALYLSRLPSSPKSYTGSRCLQCLERLRKCGEPQPGVNM
ncbi:hypothetical protein AMTRI_Chr09g20530 [Amborella trichopoda]